MFISILVAIGIMYLIKLVVTNLSYIEFESHEIWNIYCGMALHLVLGIILGYIFWG